MTQSNSLTPRQIDSIKAYKELSTESRSAILSAIVNLKMMSLKNQRLTPEIMLEELTATGHLDIALGCYEAELIGHREWS